MERQEYLKQIYGGTSKKNLSLVDSTSPKQITRNKLKLPKISPFNGKEQQLSPLSLMDGLESSMLSHKRRPAPRRP